MTGCPSHDEWQALFEPDLPRVMMVWHSQLPCHSKVLKLRSTRVTVKRRVPLGAATNGVRAAA